VLLQPTVPASEKAPPRIGNLGHITRLANKLIQAANNNPEIKAHLEVSKSLFCFVIINQAFWQANCSETCLFFIGFINGANSFNNCRGIPNGSNGKLMFCKVGIQLKMCLTGLVGKKLCMSSRNQ
jgi:hypothetical protein